MNQAGQTVKGAVSIANSQSTSSSTYTTLSSPDQVAGIVLPTSGLIQVRYWATWQESVAGAARAAIFVGANQLKSVGVVSAGLTGSQPQAAATNASTAAVNAPLTSFPYGLLSVSGENGNYGGDVTTGQAVALPGGGYEWDGAVISTSGQFQPAGGPCDIWAVAGTYTVSVQFKASSGSVTAANRQLWVQALSFA